MFSKVKKVFGGIVAIFIVLFVIDACFGESDEGSSDYIAWWERRCPKCVFVEKQELKTPNPICDAGGGLRIKVSPMTLRIYKVKNEYKPQSEWEFKYTSDLTVTPLLPDGIEKVWIYPHSYGDFLKGTKSIKHRHSMNNKEVGRFVDFRPYVDFYSKKSVGGIDNLKTVGFSVGDDDNDCKFKFE